MTRPLPTGGTRLQSGCEKRHDPEHRRTSAPELTVPYWIDGDGKQRPPLTLEELGARSTDFCSSTNIGATGAIRPDSRLSRRWFKIPASRTSASPTVQTAFEGTYVNTRHKLPVDQQRYGLRIPFGHESRSPLGVNPATMENYCTGGTPWFVAIDPNGVVLQDGFSIDTDRFIRAVGESAPVAR